MELLTTDHFYKLGPDGKTPTACSGAEWRAEFEAQRHHIALWTDGANQVTAIFFGLRLGTHSPPRLFEIKVDTLLDGTDIVRYATYDETIAAFKAFIEKCREPDRLPTEEAWIADPITRERMPFTE